MRLGYVLALVACLALLLLPATEGKRKGRNNRGRGGKGGGKGKQGNKRGGLTWYGPVADEADCLKMPDNVEINDLKEKKPFDLCENVRMSHRCLLF